MPSAWGQRVTALEAYRVWAMALAGSLDQQAASAGMPGSQPDTRRLEAVLAGHSQQQLHQLCR